MGPGGGGAMNTAGLASFIGGLESGMTTPRWLVESKMRLF